MLLLQLSQTPRLVAVAGVGRGVLLAFLLPLPLPGVQRLLRRTQTLVGEDAQVGVQVDLRRAGGIRLVEVHDPAGQYGLIELPARNGGLRGPDVEVDDADGDVLQAPAGIVDAQKQGAQPFQQFPGGRGDNPRLCIQVRLKQRDRGLQRPDDVPRAAATGTPAGDGGGDRVLQQLFQDRGVASGGCGFRLDGGRGLRGRGNQGADQRDEVLAGGRVEVGIYAGLRHGTIVPELVGWSDSCLTWGSMHSRWFRETSRKPSRSIRGRTQRNGVHLDLDGRRDATCASSAGTW